MAKTNTVYLDLDTVVPEMEIVVKLDKKSHPLMPISVEDFVKNIQTLEKLGTGQLDAATEKGLIVDMLVQVLPSIGTERLNKLSMLQLNKLIDFTREHSGEKKVEAAATVVSKDPPTGE
jgi:hypothetical protein